MKFNCSKSHCEYKKHLLGESKILFDIKKLIPCYHLVLFKQAVILWYSYTKCHLRFVLLHKEIICIGCRNRT